MVDARRRLVASCCLCAAAVGFSTLTVVGGNGLVDTMKHDIFVATGKGFDSQITAHRKSGVATVLFYKDNAACKAFIDGAYNDLAIELRGMAKVAALDCDIWSEYCEKEGIADFPSVFIYPPQPFSPMKYEGKMVAKDMATATLRHIPSSHVKTLHQEEKAVVDAFLTTNVAVPKVLLFSSRDKAPVLFNALANSFHDRMSFGFVSEKEVDIAKRFNVKSYPTLLVLKGELVPGKSGDLYTGEMKFPLLHEWLNIRSETFVKGGGYQTEETAEEIKPWLVQKVPEMTRASHQDVCFRHKVHCVIFMSASGPPSDSDMEMLESLAAHYEATASDRTAKFKFSWIDASVEEAFTEVVGGDNSQSSVVIFNPHKRLRFLKLGNEEAATRNAIEGLVERILGGDARFTNVKGQKLPAFAARDDSKKGDEKKGDEKKKGDEL